MKKLLFFALVLLTAVALAACGGDAPKPPEDEYDEVFTVTIDDTDHWTPFTADDVTFANSDDDVIDISDDGKTVTFTGLVVGEAEITATSKDETLTALVKVVTRGAQPTEFNGTYAYNPPTDNFCFEVAFTENGKSDTTVFAKIGDEEAIIDEYSDWQQYANLLTGAYFVVVDGHWYDDVQWGFDTFEETGGLGSPFDSFSSFVGLLESAGFGNEKLKEYYVGEETFLGVKCWVFDSKGFNNIYAKYWVDPSNGCSLKKVGTTTDIVHEVTKYDLNYTVWDSKFLPY